MALFNSELARSAAQKSAEARKAYSAQRKEWVKIQSTIPPVTIQEQTPKPIAKPVNAYADELARAQAELLQELRETPSAKDKAALSQAIKNLREAWHMETGKPKPGTIKPERVSSRQQVRPSSEPQLDTPSNSGPAGQQ